jgi:HlyD family type I secretion membrane fusion protein
MSLVITDPRQAPVKPVSDSLRAPATTGIVAILVFFVGLGAWAALFEIASAVQGAAVIRVESQRQAVQHPDGGVVKELLVKEGELVQQGQVLIRLDDTMSKAQLDLLSGQYYGYKAIEARLETERDRQDSITFPADLLALRDDPDIKRLMAIQVDQFNNRHKSLDGQISVLRQRQEQARQQINGYQSEVASADRQLSLTNDELNGTQELYQKGYAPKTKVLALQRQAAQLAGQKGDYLANIARAKDMMAESEMQIAQLQKDRDTEISDQLRDTHAKLVDLEPRFRTARDTLARTELKAPRTGHVVALTAYTVGGVIQPREHVLDIVPNDSPLVVEGQFRPEDIDDIRVGAEAQVHLTAFKSRITPAVGARVTEVSADRLADPRTGAPYYLVRVELNKSDLEQLPNVTLTAGMPAEITIPTEKRSVMMYLMAPLMQSFRHALREK